MPALETPVERGHSHVQTDAMVSTPKAIIEDGRKRVAEGFRNIVSGDPQGTPEWVQEIADGTDMGFFGPGSAAWAVHGSLSTLVGGVRALLMQALHPGALAGVMQHSRYQEDALGRLAGTTQWLTVVTFGDTNAAERECARVRGLHRRVTGTYSTADGPKAYAASDPDLLRWVHVAFTDSFLSTALVWGAPIPGGPDAYVREWALAGELVGVTDAPKSVRELRDQINDFAPVLRGDAATLETVDFIRNVPFPAAARPPYAVLFAGAVATMPASHRELLRVSAPPLAVMKPAVAAMLGGLQLAIGSTSPSQCAAEARITRLGAA